MNGLKVLPFIDFYELTVVIYILSVLQRKMFPGTVHLMVLSLVIAINLYKILGQIKANHYEQKKSFFPIYVSLILNIGILAIIWL
jgi:hypothetical protein